MLGGLLDVRHGVDRLADCLAAFDSRVAGAGNRRFRRRYAGAVFGQGPDHGLKRTGGLGKGFCLLAGTFCDGAADIGETGAERLGVADALLRGYQRCADRFKRRVEGGGNIAIGFRQIATDTGLKIAGGEGRQRRTQQCRRFRTVIVTLFRQFAAVAQAQFVETQRDGNLGIDHYQTDDVLHGLCQFAAFPAAAGQDGTRRVFGHQPTEQMFQNDGVTGDLPTRIETHAAGIVGKNLHPLGIKRVETCIRQHTPVRGLQIVQAVELVFTFERRRTVRHGLETVHHIPQARLDVGLEHAAIIAQEIGLRLVEAGKAQPSRQACTCRSARLI
ncbi:hypothetical protein D3C80_1164670 [compost metagenome]